MKACLLGVLAWAHGHRQDDPLPENRDLSEPVQSPHTKRDRAEGSDKAPKCTQEVTDKSVDVNIRR